MKKGLNVGEGNIYEYMELLKKKQYIKVKRTMIDSTNAIDEIIVTETGLKAIKYNHLLSESKREITQARFAKIQRMAIIISIPASPITSGIEERSQLG